MKEEIRSIEKNNSWKLVDLPIDKKPIELKWFYKTKVNPKGEIVRLAWLQKGICKGKEWIMEKYVLPWHALKQFV